MRMARPVPAARWHRALCCLRWKQLDCCRRPSVRCTQRDRRTEEGRRQAPEKACGHFRKCDGGRGAVAAFAGACVGDQPDLAVSRPRQRRLQRRHAVGIAFQRRVDLVPVVIEFLHQNAVRPRPAGPRFDPRRDPRTEKPGRKQWNREYLRVRKSCGKPALFSQNSAEGIPIESSHA